MDGDVKMIEAVRGRYDVRVCERAYASLRFRDWEGGRWALSLMRKEG